MFNALGVVTSLIPVLLVIGLAVWGIRRMLRRDTPQPVEGHGVRRFFQYLLLYGLLWVVGIGVSGLLGRVFDLPRTVSENPAQLALYTAFTVVGVPLFALVAVWTRRRLLADPQEARARAWLLYLTVAALTCLSVAMTGLHGVLSWAVGLTGFSGTSLGSLLVWGTGWFAHWWIDRRTRARDEFTLHRLVGSVIGLVVTAVGAGSLLSDSFESLFGLTPQRVFAGETDRFLPGAVTLAVGLAVWLVYWLVPALSYRRGPLWLANVLLAGVAGGLVTAITGASVVLYQVLVWLIGDPSSSIAREHFASVPGALAAVVVGVVVWWYHRVVLQQGGGAERTEVGRIYEYLIAGIGLLAAAAGVILLVAAIIEGFVGSAELIVGMTSAVNTVLAAVTLLVVGAPVWWIFWRRIEAAARTDPDDEHASPTRRVYVFVLFGVAGVAAVVALLAGVFVLLQDVFQANLSSQTARSLRYALGVLVAAGLVSGYHWGIYRDDRQYTRAGQRGPRFTLLVGPPDAELARTLERRLGGKARLWPRTDGSGAPWSADELVAALSEYPEGEVVVVSGEHGLTMVPVDRD